MQVGLLDLDLVLVLHMPDHVVVPCRGAATALDRATERRGRRVAVSVFVSVPGLVEACTWNASETAINRTQVREGMSLGVLSVLPGLCKCLWVLSTGAFYTNGCVAWSHTVAQRRKLRCCRGGLWRLVWKH